MRQVTGGIAAAAHDGCGVRHGPLNVPSVPVNSTHGPGPRRLAPVRSRPGSAAAGLRLLCGVPTPTLLPRAAEHLGPRAGDWAFQGRNPGCDRHCPSGSGWALLPLRLPAAAVGGGPAVAAAKHVCAGVCDGRRGGPGPAPLPADLAATPAGDAGLRCVANPGSPCAVALGHRRAPGEAVGAGRADAAGAVASQAATGRCRRPRPSSRHPRGGQTRSTNSAAVRSREQKRRLARWRVLCPVENRDSGARVPMGCRELADAPPSRSQITGGGDAGSRTPIFAMPRRYLPFGRRPRGATGRIRTRDLPLRRRALCLLSYGSTGQATGRPRWPLPHRLDGGERPKLVLDGRQASLGDRPDNRPRILVRRPRLVQRDPPVGVDENSGLAVLAVDVRLH